MFNNIDEGYKSKPPSGSFIYVTIPGSTRIFQANMITVIPEEGLGIENTSRKQYMSSGRSIIWLIYHILYIQISTLWIEDDGWQIVEYIKCCIVDWVEFRFTFKRET